jgi:hypothetical protein
MGNYKQLKAAIAAVIKANGMQEITGNVLQETLLSLVSNIGDNATFAGMATPDTNPGTPDQNIFYLAAQPGVYSNFGGVELTDQVLIFTNKNDIWVKNESGIATAKQVTKLENKIVGLSIKASEYVIGYWVGDNSPKADSKDGYLRCNVPYQIDANTNDVISMYNSQGKKVRISDYRLTIKLTDANGNKVNWSYQDSGNDILPSANAKFLYIHTSTPSTISDIDGFFFLGMFSKKIVDYITELDKRSKEIEEQSEENKRQLEGIINTAKLNYTPTKWLNAYADSAYVGDSLIDNPRSNATNSALEVLDVSEIEDDTVIYILDSLGVNSFDGWTFKFFGVDNKRILTSIGGSIGTNDRGYIKPNGAVKLGLHFSNSRIEGDKVQFLKSLFIYNIPYMQKSVYEQIEDLNKEVKDNEENINLLGERVTVLENKDSTSYKEALKILFIGSSFGVDTVREVGNICKSFNKDVIIGNAYIGAATLGIFIARWEAEKGVTYYKWKYQATDWEQYNGTTGKWSSEPGSDITDEGELAPANDTVKMDWILADEAWNFVILQNGAYQSPYEDQSSFWEKGEDGIITNNIVQGLIDKCKKACLYSNPVFGMNMTWAFSIYHTISDSHGPSGADDDKWLDYGSNQRERQIGMWTNISKNYKDCITNCPDVKFVIPSGTAVQNARTNLVLRNSTIYTSAVPAPPSIEQAEVITSLDGIESTYPFMDNTVNWRNKTDFTRDSIHANFGITRYIIAGTLFQTFIAKLFNIDIENCTYRIPLSSGDYREQLCTAVTDDNISLINKCIKEACNKPFEITTIS